jgi:hypothetical protein
MPEHVRSEQGAERDLARRAERLRAGGLKADTWVRPPSSGLEVEVDRGPTSVVAHASGTAPRSVQFLMCFANCSSSFSHSLCRPAL